MNYRSRALALSLTAALACTSPASQDAAPAEASTDAPTLDAPLSDAPSEAALEAGFDALPEANAPDALADSAADSAPDASPLDASADSATDATPDVAPDAAPDAALADAPAEAAPDAPGVTFPPRRFGGVGPDLPEALARDSLGNLFVAGTTGSGTLDLGGGPLNCNAGELDLFFLSLGPDGTHRWSRCLGGANEDHASSAAVDAAGNLYVTGYLSSPTVDFGGGPLTAPSGTVGQSLFLASYTSAGGYRWARVFGRLLNALGNPRVAVTSAGQVWLAGGFGSTVDFGGGALTPAGMRDVFLARFDATTGAHQSSQRFGAAGDDTALGLAASPAGGVVLSGAFANNIDLGGGPLTSAGLNDAFVASYDATGAHLWSRRFGSSGGESATGVTVDSAGNIVVAGTFTGIVDLGGGPLTTAGGADLFVLGLSSTGAHRWSRRFGSPTTESPAVLSGDASGRAHLAVPLTDAVDLGMGPLTPVGAPDALAVGYDPAGALLYARLYGAAGGESPTVLAAIPGAGAVVGGIFTGSFTVGGATLTSAGQGDGFLFTVGP